MRFPLRAAACAALALAAHPAAADELVDRLNAIPGLIIVQERPNPFGGRFFVLTYEQPVNHLKPWKGTFRQRVTLLHRGFSAPTVFYSGGYGIGINPSRTEVTQIVDGNQLVIEHRFFAPSRPDPADWSDLTIFQQASDDHRLVRAFRALYAGRWLRSGASKGGMQATYHTRFYPGDTDGLVAYVTPNDAIDSHDRYERFLENVGPDPACRESLKAVQREALARRDEILPMVVDQLGPDAFDQVIGSPEKALELLIAELPFTFWQGGNPEFDCPAIPPADASTADIFFFIDSWPGFFFFTDAVIPAFEPYYFQAGTQLGYPKLADAHFRDLLLFPGADVPRSFVRPEFEAQMGPFQPLAMLDVDLFVRLLGRRQMFVYGENDPWGAERFDPRFAADSYVYVAPGANHGARVANLAPAERDAAIATIRRWAGLPPLVAAAQTALDATLAREPALDVVERMTRRARPRDR